MDSSQLLGITTFTYLFSTLLYVFIFIFKSEKRLGMAATVFTAAALLIQTIGIGMRWQESYQMEPSYSMPETLETIPPGVITHWNLMAP